MRGLCDEVTVSESFNQPLISIIIPVYNAAHYFERCIKSVLEQTYKNLEIILIDDGSTDGSEKLCDQYKEIDDRIKVVHKKNGGQSSARNLGLTMITGDYVGFVDSDDYIEKDMYEYLYNNMVKYHADISICHFYSENSNFTSSEKIKVCDNKEAAFLILEDKEIQSFSWNKLVKKELLNGYCYPEGRYFEDTASVCQWFKGASKVVISNVPKYYYVNNPDSTCRKGKDILYYHNFLAFRDRLIFSQQFYPEYEELCISKAMIQAMGCCNIYIRGSKTVTKSHYDEARSFILSYYRAVKHSRYIPKKFRLRMHFFVNANLIYKIGFKILNLVVKM